MREPSRTKGPRLCPEQLQPPGPETPAQSGDPPLLPALAASPFCGQLGLLSAVCRLRSPDHHLSYWAALRTELSLGPGDRWHSQGVGFPGATVPSPSLWRLWGPCPLYLSRDTRRKCSPWAWVSTHSKWSPWALDPSSPPAELRGAILTPRLFFMDEFSIRDYGFA